MSRQVAALAGAAIDDRVKSLLPGSLLMKVVGEGVLDQAVSSLGASIRDP